ncbi:hypothetical protein VTG60DRAFT_5599 [Thermothelomyces hinnuleus]
MAERERPLNSCQARFFTACLYSGLLNVSFLGTNSSAGWSSFGATLHRPLTHETRFFSRASATRASLDSPSKLASISRKTCIWMSGKTAARASKQAFSSRRSGCSGSRGRSSDSVAICSGVLVDFGSGTDVVEGCNAVLFEDALFEDVLFEGVVFGGLFGFIARSPGMPRRPVKAMLRGLRMYDVQIISYWIGSEFPGGLPLRTLQTFGHGDVAWPVVGKQPQSQQVTTGRCFVL